MTRGTRRAAALLQATFALGTLGSGCMGGGGSTTSGGGGGSLTLGFPSAPNALAAVSCPATPGATVVNDVGTNVIPIQVGGNTYCTVNQPCVSIKICAPGSAVNCQTISDILVDTGSFGLRVFNSAFTSYGSNLLTPVTDGSGNPIAECAEFGSSNAWGPVVQADVYLGGEPVLSALPIQLMNANFATIPAHSPCASSVGTGPGGSGTPFNGILGVGLQTVDNYGMYYHCTGGNCTSFGAGAGQAIPNPVAKLGTDKNGVIVDMPALSNDQQGSATGALIMGIGTGAHGGNNTPAGVTVYAANGLGYFKTYLGGVTLGESFIDSGSNLYYFPGDGLGECGDGTFCLQQTQCFQATVAGFTGAPATPITFKLLAEAAYLGDAASDALGADAGVFGASDSFDWGLPFFYGRKVYVGFVNSGTPIGTGPFWAF